MVRRLLLIDPVAQRWRLERKVLKPYIVVSGRAPGLTVELKNAAELPARQRSAFYWLLERELDGERRFHWRWTVRQRNCNR